jgi:hypothetical protein
VSTTADGTLPASHQLFVMDPLARLQPAKDSSVALMQALQRAGGQAWSCELADLWAGPHPDGGYGAWVRATPLRWGHLAGAGAMGAPWQPPTAAPGSLCRAVDAKGSTGG